MFLPLHSYDSTGLFFPMPLPFVGNRRAQRFRALARQPCPLEGFPIHQEDL